MRGILPAVIRASEILGVDAEMRPVWQEFLDNLAPLPRSDDPDAVAMREDERQRPTPSRRGRRRPATDRRLGRKRPTWIRALPPVVNGRGSGRPDGNTMPMWFFDLCTLENTDAETMRLANATLDGYGGAAAACCRRSA